MQYNICKMQLDKAKLWTPLTNSMVSQLQLLPSQGLASRALTLSHTLIIS